MLRTKSGFTPLESPVPLQSIFVTGAAIYPYRKSREKTPYFLTGFTLLEITVSIVIFVVIIMSGGTMFFSIQRAWHRQRDTISLVQNARWAMEFMVNEMRQGDNVQIFGGGTRLRFQPYPGPPTQFVWYWRGNTDSDSTGLGARTYLYRGVGNNINQAYSVRQQLVNFVVDNPSGNDIFIDIANDLCIIEITVRPRPNQPEEPDNRNYTLRTQVWLRN